MRASRGEGFGWISVQSAWHPQRVSLTKKRSKNTTHFFETHSLKNAIIIAVTFLNRAMTIAGDPLQTWAVFTFKLVNAYFISGNTVDITKIILTETVIAQTPPKPNSFPPEKAKHTSPADQEPHHKHQHRSNPWTKTPP